MVDVVCVPVFHKLSEKYIEAFIDEFLSISTSFRKYVVSTIPYISRTARTRLVSKYIKWFNKSDFVIPELVCVDFSGSNPISRYTFHNYVVTYIRALEAEFGSPAAVLGVNVKYGKTADKYEEIPARDLASYFALLDIQGKNHKRQSLPGEVAEKTKSEPPLQKLKILNRAKYVYISLAKALAEQLLLPEEASHLPGSPAEEFSRSKLERMVRLVNVRRFLAETRTLRMVFTDPSEPAKYLKEKEAAKIDESMLRNIRKLARQYRARSLY
jgi:hypothetical protein